MRHKIDIDLSELSPVRRSFINKLKRECSAADIKIIIPDTKAVKLDGEKYGGWFSHEDKELVVSGLNPQFFDILVHESCHFDQWLEGEPSITNTRRYDDKHMKDMTEMQLEGYLNRERICEEDCERRSVQKIIDYDLDINITQYIKGANAYIYLFNVMKLTGKWPKCQVFRNRKLRAVMPGVFMDDYTENPVAIDELYLETLYNIKR